jgi:hypothetical protein
MRRMLSIAWFAALAAFVIEPSLVRGQTVDPSGQATPGTPGIPTQVDKSTPVGTLIPDGSQTPRSPATPSGSNPDGSPQAGAGTGTDSSTGTGTGSGADTNIGSGTGGQDSGAGANNANTGGGGSESGLGGFGGASGAPPGVIGDMSPIGNAVVHSAASTRFPNLPNPVPPPTVGNRNPGVVSSAGTTSVLFRLTGLKVSDNQSPIPQDRFFYSFNYFDNLNASVDRKSMSPVQNLQLYHQLFGLEKTFLDGNASIGFRVPLNTLSFKSTANMAGLGGTSTSAGDLSVFLKYVFYRQEGTLLSTGLQVTMPTGPGAFAGNKYYSYFRDTQIQPFVGFLFKQDRLYFQGFSSILVPTMSQDVTMWFNDLSLGYYVYRAANNNRLISAIIPTAELHINTPLNHRGYGTNDVAGTPDVVDMTFGTNVQIYQRAILSAAYVTPVTGPKPFNAEFVLLLNIRFGGARSNSAPLSPPTF